MSTPATNLNDVKPPKYNEVRVKGRVTHKSKLKTSDGLLYIYILTLPAPDEYTRPATIEVRSREDISEKDTELTAICTLDGYTRTFSYTDKETGEQKRGSSTTNYLNVRN